MYHFISRMKISTLLLAGISFFVLINIATNALSVYVLNDMKNNFEVVVTQNNEQAKRADNLNATLAALKISLNKSILLNSDEEKNEEYKKYKATIEKYETESQIARSKASPNEKSLWDEERTRYENTSENIESIYRAILESRDSEAIKNLKKTEPMLDEWSKTLAAITESQNALSIRAYKNTKDATYKNTVAIISVALIAAILSISISFLIKKGLLNQIGEEPKVVAEITKSIGEGNLSDEIKTKIEAPHSLVSEIQSMQKNLIKVINSVREGAHSVAIASNEIAQGNQDLSERTENQASSIEQTTTAMAGLTEIVSENAQSTIQANELACIASNLSKEGGETIGQVISTMQDINTSSQKINNIISVIDNIAFQTNILALNAAVEAARAGEQGRGFAVVATEVRNLASRSSHAAKEIKELIENSQVAVLKGNELVSIAGDNISKTINVIHQVTERITAINDSCSKQTQMFNYVSDSLTSIDRDTQQNSALVEQIAAASDQLKQQASDLVNSTSYFRT